MAAAGEHAVEDDPADGDAIFVERVGDALHLQLRPVEIDCLH